MPRSRSTSIVLSLFVFGLGIGILVITGVGGSLYWVSIGILNIILGARATFISFKRYIE